jgi:hypothetical protein
MWFKKKRKPQYTGVSVLDIPETLQVNKIYVVGEKQNKWVALMICPCGCTQTIQLNLLSEATPCWRITIHRSKAVTVRPSVWRITGCKSHFTLIKGNLNWVHEWSWE